MTPPARSITWLVLAGALAVGCKPKAPDSPVISAQPQPVGVTPDGGIASAPADGPKALLEGFLKPGADHAALTKPLRPTKADYEAVFEPAFAAQLEAAKTPLWDSGGAVLAPKPGQTELLLNSATSDDFKKGTAAAAEFPGGYKQVADKFKPGVTLYRFKFVEPGKTIGMAYDGLVLVNGNWRLFPKPWQVK